MIGLKWFFLVLLGFNIVLLILSMRPRGWRIPGGRLFVECDVSWRHLWLGFGRENGMFEVRLVPGLRFRMGRWQR